MRALLLGLLMAMIPVGANADRSRRVPLPEDFLGFYESTGEGENMTPFTGKECSQSSWAGGNQIDKMRIESKTVTYRNGPQLARTSACSLEAFEETADHSDKDGLLIAMNCRGSSNEPFRQRQIWTLHEVGGLYLLTVTDPRRLTTELYIKCTGR